MKHLILVPTQAELDVIAPILRERLNRDDTLQLCGFGPIAAASRTAALIEQLKPSNVTLIGIAGTFADAHPIGSAITFGKVCCWGIGVGTGANFQTANEAGFEQWSGEPAIDECIELTSASEDVLLTCCAASADASDAQRRRAAMPSVVAEDMEGFGVALSCQIAGVPLTIIRGISNQVGDRNKQNWQIEPALRAAASLAVEQKDAQP